MRVLLILGLVLCASAERVRYDGYQVLDITPANAEQVDLVHQLSNDNDLDFWREGAMPGMTTTILVPPHRIADVLANLKTAQVAYVITDHNYQEVIDQERGRLAERYGDDKKLAGSKAYNASDFNNFADIEAELPLMAGRCHSNLTCGVSSIGQSVLGDEIWMLTIKSGKPDLPGIWIDSAIHAREWLAPATVLSIMDHMTTNYSLDVDVKRLIDSYDWYFVPIMNPDGYIHSWTTDRNWRKSRNVNSGSSCMGTDLNRNYDINWGTTGSSSDPCSSTYHGSSAASEPETAVVQAKIDELADSLAAFLTFHTAATMWLIPWGHQVGGVCVLADDHDEMMVILDRTVDAVQNTHGDLTWARGNSCLVIYPTSGTTQDYAKAKNLNMPIAITPELRGQFVMPPSSIPGSFEENWNGIVEMVNAIEDNPRK